MSPAAAAIADQLDPLLTYKSVRHRMRAGDVIAFGGRGVISETIKAVTRCPVSHVGTILRTREGDAGAVVEVIESTSLDGCCGVTASRFSRRLLEYDGEVWYLPLAARPRDRMNEPLFVEFLLAADGVRYDGLQAILAGLHRLGIAATQEDGGRYFCSELVAAALKRSGAIPDVSSSEVTPAGLVEWAIYDQVVQLKGAPLAIPRVNSMTVAARRIEV